VLPACCICSVACALCMAVGLGLHTIHFPTSGLPIISNPHTKHIHHDMALRPTMTDAVDTPVRIAILVCVCVRVCVCVCECVRVRGLFTKLRVNGT